MRISAPHSAQRRGKISSMRASSTAQRKRAGERSTYGAGSPVGSGAHEGGVAGRAKAVSLKRAAGN